MSHVRKGTLIAGCGVALFIAGVALALTALPLVFRGTRAHGDVVAVERRDNRTAVRVRYRAQHGMELGDVFPAPDELQVGDGVDLLFDPLRPGRVVLDTGVSLPIPAVALAATGVMLLASGLWLRMGD